MCRADLAASGDNASDEICDEAQYLTPAIEKLRAAIARTEEK